LSNSYNLTLARNYPYVSSQFLATLAILTPSSVPGLQNLKQQIKTHHAKHSVKNSDYQGAPNNVTLTAWTALLQRQYSTLNLTFDPKSRKFLTNSSILFQRLTLRTLCRFHPPLNSRPRQTRRLPSQPRCLPRTSLPRRFPFPSYPSSHADLLSRTNCEISST
jgi:hypothetical protein